MTDEAKSSVGGRAKLWHSPWELLINKEGFQYPKNDYTNGAWLKEIKIEISRVHGSLYMMIYCDDNCVGQNKKETVMHYFA